MEIPQITYLNHNNEANLLIELSNIDLSLANAIRRVAISDLPVVAFHPSNIEIICNTSVLHNQFIEHRLSLIPICMFLSNSYNIISEIDVDTSIRKYKSKTPLLQTPKFMLNVKNNEETISFYRENRKQDIENDTTINVTSEDIKFDIDDSKSTLLKINDYIRPDLKSQVVKQKYNLTQSEYFLINKLKIDSESKGHELDLRLEPVLGFGSQDSIFSPVGTVVFKSVQDSQEKIEQVFKYKLDQINRERVGKELAELSPEEIDILYKEYLTLDAKRVISTNNLGRPNKFCLNFEGTGILSPAQILLNSLLIIKYDLMDLYNCINFNNKGYVLDKNKLSLNKSNTILDGIDIQIKNCDHTLGNLISSYTQTLFTSELAVSKYLLNFCSYKKNHPLDKNIFLRLELLTSLDCDHILDYMKRINREDNDLYEILNEDEYNFKKDEKKSIIILSILKQSILKIISQINGLHRNLETIISEKKIDSSVVNMDYIHFNINNQDKLDKITNNFSEILFNSYSS